jgi:hypothetical protein
MKKGPNGGLMLDVAGVDAELLTAGNTVTFNVFVPNTTKPVSTKGFTAAVLIVGSGGRETVTLAPHGENSLKADAKSPIAAGRDNHIDHQNRRGKIGTSKIQKVGISARRKRISSSGSLGQQFPLRLPADQS